MNQEVKQLRMFLQEKNDESPAFISCEGVIDAGGSDVHVGFTLNGIESVAPILTGDAIECKPNATGPRSFLVKKETGGLILHGIRFTDGEPRIVERDDGTTVVVRPIRFDRVEHIIAASAPLIQLRKVAARRPAAQTQATA